MMRGQVYSVPMDLVAESSMLVIFASGRRVHAQANVSKCVYMGVSSNGPQNGESMNVYDEKSD